MGLIKTAIGTISNTVNDSLYKEYIVCPQPEKNVLLQRGVVKHGSGDTKSNDGIISNGSVIVVPEGTAMMIVDNGEIKEFSAEAGEFVYDSSTEPSIFSGNLGTGIINTIKNIGKRITFGGQTARDQRVYYINLLVQTGNEFESGNPRPITDSRYGTLQITFSGEFAYRIADPVVLISTILGSNGGDSVTFEEAFGNQINLKFVEKLSVALGTVMRKHNVSIGDITAYHSDISDEMNVALNDSLRNKYGIEITDVALADVNMTEESRKQVSKIDQAMIFSDSSMQSGLLADATAEAMKNASSNSNGAMMGFMGMNMAMNAGANVIGRNDGGVATSDRSNLFSSDIPEPGTISIFGNKSSQPENNVVNNEPLKNPTESISEEPVNNNVESVPTEAVNNTTESIPTEPVNNTTESVSAEPANNQAIKFCPNCGTKAVGKFCVNCGTKISD